MKKIIDKKVVLITTIIFVVGIVSGIIFLLMTENLDKLIIKNEIKEYFDIIKTNEIHSFKYVMNSFKYNFTYISLITIVSIVYILYPITIFINFYKGMLIGFLISSIILTYKFKGVIYAILAIFPHHILMSILLIIYSSIMFNFAFKLFRGTVKGENINLKLFIKKVGIIYIGALFLVLLISLSEIFINPILLKPIL